MTLTAYRLTFPDGLHIGDHRPNDYGSSLDHVPSDTLHAALLAMEARKGNAVPGKEGPGYQISSAFPFAMVAGRILYFLPKPMLGFDLGEKAIDYAKELKKTRWLDVDYYGRLLRGESIDFGGSDRPHLQGQYVSATSFPSNYKMTQSQARQRVVVPRYGSEAANPFITDRKFFAKGAGLYFLFRGDGTAHSKLEDSLQLLSHEGLGTDRNIGNGHFTYERDEVTLNVPPEGPYRTNLGLFCPSSREELQNMLDGPHVAYRTSRRGGWITTPGGLGRRKRSITIFEEGGIFKLERETAGRAGVDLSPPEYHHPIWRNGQSIFLPIKVGAE